MLENNINLLLVEDDYEDIFLIKSMLNGMEQKFTIFSAENLQDAIKVIDSDSIDIILLDLGLPESYGIDTLNKLLKHSSDIPIVVVTGTEDVEQAKLAINHGAQAYLCKNCISKIQLSHTIFTSLERFSIIHHLIGDISRFKVLVDQNMDGILVMDDQNTVLFANKAVETILDKSLDQLIGYPLKFDLDLNRMTELSIKHRDGSIIYAEMRVEKIIWENHTVFLTDLHDVTLRKKMEMENRALISELKEALANIKTLQGLIPICSSCKKIRDDDGFWNQIELYIKEHTDAEFSHGLCPDCIKKLYPQFSKTN